MVLNVVGSNPTSHPKKSSVVERLLRIFLFYMIFLFYGLSTEEKIESEKCDDFSGFLETLEDKCGFNLNCCSWMSCEVLVNAVID